MGLFEAPEQAMVGVFQSGTGQVATFPGMPYRRYVRALTVQCTSQGPVNVYHSAITPASRIALSSNGLSNTFGPVNIRPVPYNAPIFVVWPNAAITDTAQAFLACDGEV